jgi:hypothetical protein
MAVESAQRQAVDTEEIWRGHGGTTRPRLPLVQHKQAVIAVATVVGGKAEQRLTG